MLIFSWYHTDYWKAISVEVLDKMGGSEAQGGPHDRYKGSEMGPL